MQGCRCGSTPGRLFRPRPAANAKSEEMFMHEYDMLNGAARQEEKGAARFRPLTQVHA